MKVLVLSDSHSALRFMFHCVNTVKPDAIVHLGDHFDDGEALKDAYPGIRIYQVPGNCDRYRCPPNYPQILIDRIFGVDFYITHGHKHHVKSYLGALLQDARTAKVAAVLYGHTHHADCHREADGLWVLNPGSCGYYGGSAGLVEVEDGSIRNCTILREEDLFKPW